MELLTLRQAAEQLGVHPSTLRRWANQGDISVVRTPGGHRRFASQELEKLARPHTEEQATQPVERLWVEQALTKTRQELVLHGEEHWLAAHDEGDRQRHRLMGRRLLGLLLQYIALDEGEGILTEAAAAGRDYAEDAVALGIPLTEAMRAMLFFRDLLVETALQLPETTPCRPERSRHLLQRMNTLLNTVHLSVAEVYEIRL